MPIALFGSGSQAAKRLPKRCMAYMPRWRHQIATQRSQESVMDKNRLEGTAKQLRGSVKEAMGKVTGNRTKQAEGAAERLAGAMQAKLGEAADALRERVKS
jgi:uncharacterized protein YjbJ (UPF0337 family)